ncbi:MAG: hypothetical protein Q9227_000600 [Pyrenula ochraceoflavens]
MVFTSPSYPVRDKDLSLRSSSDKNAPLTEEERIALAADSEGGQAERIDISGLEDDEQAWELDDAADDLNSPDKPHESEDSPPPYEVDEKPVRETVGEFISAHHKEPTTPGGTTATRVRLPCPVIIPQRRPKDKSRGFIRAYAPVLEDSGIDQKTFIDFIEALDKASRASGVFTAVNVAAMGAGFVPEPISQAVSAGVQLVVGVASEVQRRYRGNEFLSAINRELFMPKGLFVMILTFKPDSPDQIIDVNLKRKTTDDLVAQQTSTPENAAKRAFKKLAISTDKTRGELAIPDCAPLVYPNIDRAAEAVAIEGENALSENQKSRLARSGDFVADYMDRRARAQYNFINPNSKLSVPDDKKWASRFSDPNHPVNSGHIVSLLTGGNVNPRPRGRRGGGPLGFIIRPAVAKVKKEVQARQMAKDGVTGHDESHGPATVYRSDEKYDDADNPYGKYGQQLRENQGKPRTLIGRILSQDVLYLMVCNLPEGVEIPKEEPRPAESSQ